MLIVLIFLVLLVYQLHIINKYKNINEHEMSYVATLTHDLKSPANAQINMLNLLLKGKFGQLNSQQYEMLKLTCSSAKYMSNLVGTVLSGYKYELNKTELNKTCFDLVTLINSVIKQNEYLISDKNLRINFNSDSNECMIYADMLQLERVLMNLISNAITYAFSGTIIIINLQTNKNKIIFSVSNKSYFIPQKELKNIFNRFSKTTTSRYNKSSTGLGLYTAKQIISMHGGHMHANCSSEGLCTFGFQLDKNISLNCANK